MIRGTDARYAYGLPILRFIPLNADLSLPVAAAIAGGSGAGYLNGGVGPFDFSGVDSDGAVELYLKIDNGSLESLTVDLSAAVDISAVTVDELVTALAGISASWTFSKDVSSLRIKGVPSSGSYWQCYGEFAEIAGFGQGYGVKILTSDTFRSFDETPTNKEDQTQTTTDANGKDTDVVRSGYRKGCTIVGVDTARDVEIMALEGGSYTAATSTYEKPTSTSSKIYFMVEIWQSKYAEGSNKEADMVGYIQKTYRSCVLTVGDEAQGDVFLDVNYNVIATTYKTPAGVVYPDKLEVEITTAAFAALHIEDV